MIRLLALAALTLLVSLAYAGAALADEGAAHVLIVPCVGVLLLAHYAGTQWHRRHGQRRRGQR